MSRTTLGIFAREPVPGRVKRRLAKEIGAKRACAIYVDCIRRTLILGRSSRLPLHIYITPPEAVSRVRRRFQIRGPVSPQHGRTLGDRMRNAFGDMLTSSPAAILIGSDSPTLPTKFVRAAARHLRRSDLVLGPAEDGGYVLIGLTAAGFRRAAGDLFSNMRWGTSTVFAKTLRRSRRLRLRVALLPLWFDIDTAADLSRVS